MRITKYNDDELIVENVIIADELLEGFEEYMPGFDPGVSYTIVDGSRVLPEVAPEVYDYNRALAAAYAVQNKYMDPNFKDLYVQGVTKGLTGDTVPNFNSYNKFMQVDLWPAFKARKNAQIIDYDFSGFKPVLTCDYDTLAAEVAGFNG